jgi:hypothetical protein
MFKHIIISVVALLGSVTTSFSQTVVPFSCTGAAQNWVVPPCVTSIDIVANGSQGGGPNGGKGAMVTATMAVRSNFTN